MNVRAHIVRDRVELRLVPDVGEALVLGLFLELFLRLVATEHIGEKHAVVLQAGVSALEITKHQLARIEDPVAEIERAENIHRRRLHGQHVGLDQPYAGLLLGV